LFRYAVPFIKYESLVSTNIMQLCC